MLMRYGTSVDGNVYLVRYTTLLCDMTTVSINDEIYNGLKLEAELQHRSIASLIEWIVLKSSHPRITKLSDQELAKEMEMLAKVIQAIENKDTMQEQSSEEDEVTKRHLKFLIFLVELAEKDPDWNASLKEKAEAFRRLES